MQQAIATWEGEGGARPATAVVLTGTINQLEWAEGIRERVGQEFDRVASAIRGVATKQNERDRLDTEALAGILEEKRLEVMSQNSAGYFIHDWSELSDQVRQMLVKDPRYKQIRIQQAERKKAAIR